MKNDLYIMLRDNSFLCRKPIDNYTYKCKFDVDDLPNIPFYYHFWTDINKYVSIFNSFCKKHNLKSILFKPGLVISKPDDALTGVDDAILNEFFLVCGARKVTLVNECMLLTSLACNYVSIIKTCRMIVIRYIKSCVIKNSIFIDTRDYTTEELMTYVKDQLLKVKV